MRAKSTAPALSTLGAIHPASLRRVQASRFENDRFLVEQLLAQADGEPLHGLDAGPDGKSRGETVAFTAPEADGAQERTLRFFADDSETEELFRLKARRVVEMGVVTTWRCPQASGSAPSKSVSSNR